MSSKQMVVANLNLVFGKKEDPLLKRLDDIVIPALKSGIIREASDKVRYLFKNCEIKEYNNELVIKGVLVKDMIVDVRSELLEGELQKADKHIPSAPYSVFMVFLKNHRMVLVKNQSESPDIRSFKVTFRYVLKEFVFCENQKKKEIGRELLPYPKVNVTGIKTSQSVKKALEDVEKITELTFRFQPLNAEWDYDPIFGGIDDSIRKVIGSKNGRMVFPSPTSKDGVAEVIENTEGLVNTKMKVLYRSDSKRGATQKKGTIKDNEISDVCTIEITEELDEAFDSIYNCKKDFSSLNVESKNNIILYDEYISKKGDSRNS